MWNSLADIAQLLLITIVAYVYFGYPVMLWLLASRRAPEWPLSSGQAPSVTLIITARNEADIMERKLQNALQLKYPLGELSIVVASDASDDGTDEIVERYHDHGVRLFRMPERMGKTPTLSKAVQDTESEIIAFSDANAMYAPDAVQYLVAPFCDSEVGSVCGKLGYLNQEDTSISQGERLYWNYENQLKQLESRFNSLIGANGSIYALRRSAFTTIDPDLSDDLGLPLAAYARGFRVVYQPEALSTEEAPNSALTGFKKKSRFVAHQLTTLARLWPQLRPFTDARFLFQVASHKLMRNLVPFFLILLMAISSATSSSLSAVLFWLQAAFYSLGLLGGITHSFGISARLLMIPVYFCTVNAAAANGVIQFFLKRDYSAWQD
jgi:cellulose synthase/poly-beta-1,6-N-acetylglucosamine synthase-like glycosyltransferase